MLANTTAPDQSSDDSWPSNSGRRRRGGRRVIVGLTKRSGVPSKSFQRCNSAGSVGRGGNPWRHSSVGSAVSGSKPDGGGSKVVTTAPFGYFVEVCPERMA